jgi:predicted nucleotidyltransferase component of viral defense system
LSRLSRPLRQDGFPKGYFVSEAHRDVFDPALKHYPRAFVQLPEYSTRDATLEACVQGLARVDVRERVVLRGSITLAQWFGDRARSPHDIDLVVRDPTLVPDSDAARELLSKLRDAACDGLRTARLTVLEHEVTVDSIWTYERAEGRRLSIPYASRDGVDSIQIDVVFSAPLHDAPVFEQLDTDLRCGVWLASKAESLAWKLLWLTTDFFPQAKDLYDALLLAEATTLERKLLDAVIADDKVQFPQALDSIRVSEDSWAALAKSNAGTEQQLRDALRAALRLNP